MNNNVKKFRRNGMAIVCYVFAALLLIYTFYTAGSTVAQINEYYGQYGMSATAGEYFTYVTQSALTPLIYTFVVFMLGYILDAVRKTDPSNYMTDEELEEFKALKKEAKEAKKIARGEKAAAKAGATVSDEESVAADFANDLDKELKADEKKSDYKKSNGNRKQYNRNNNHRQYGGNRNNNRKSNHKNNQNNNQNKSGAEESKAAQAQEETVAMFDAKISEE